ncbi:MAG: extracellular solute-binding protein family 1, partial [Chloroflexi bacterium]|nr:extracellular solute-binding protein family 1 [Chloroflexota bacterium]
ANISFILNGSPADQVTWNKVSSLFHAKHPNINVTVNVISVPTWSVFFSKVLSQVAGGKAPDIIGIATEGAQLIGAKDLALPLDDLIKRDHAELGDFFSDVNPKLIEPFKYKGKTLALPYSWNNMVIFYQTKLFKKLGIAAPGPNWTGDDFVRIAQKVRATGPYGFNLWPGGTFGIVCWMYAAGGGLLNSTFTKSTANNPANVVAMKFLQDLIWKTKVAPRPGAPDAPLFEAGRVAMVSAGRWPVPTYNAAKFYDYDVQYLPTLGPGRKNIYGVGANPIYKHTPHVEEAWTFLKYLTTRELQQYITGLGSSIPARRSIAYNAKYMTPPHNFKIYYDSLNSTASVPAPPQFNEMETAVDTLYSKLLANEITPEAMLKQLDTQLTSVLAQQA